MAPASHRRLLLLSNSTMANTKYMEWTKGLITDFLNSSVKEILFVPFAGVSLSWDSYTEMVQKALPEYKIIPIHKAGNMIEAVNKAEAIMVGGGNTFHLLAKLYEHRLLECIRERVLGSKAFYIGWSAGSNVAGPDVGTSNDMPIVWPPSDKALNLVPYNLNPHYSEWKPPNYKGEGRIDRLNEAALMKKRPIVAFSEGVAIKVTGGKHQVIAPPLPAEFLAKQADERVLKIWTYKNGQVNISQVDLTSELIGKIESLAK